MCLIIRCKPRGCGYSQSVMRTETLDFIGDLHGRFAKLVRLMDRLGYRREGETFIPPAGHRAVFLGDLIDPKLDYAETGGVRSILRAVKAMADRGDALVILGNHELNALCYHTPDGAGGWLRPHDEINNRQHAGTLADFLDHEDENSEWRTLWMPWFKTLPLWLDLGSVRAIHACWRDEDVTRLRGRLLDDPALLLASAMPHLEGHGDGMAIERLLKGIEAPLPPGECFHDHTGIKRTEFRVRWWAKAAPGIPCADLVFPAAPGVITNAPASPEALKVIPGYPADAPPLFIGHYFKPADAPLTPEAPNLACLDHSAAKDGPLVAYRWRGEATLNPNHYITDETPH